MHLTVALKTDLRTWCDAQGKNATYIAQRCFTISKTNTYMTNLLSGCEEKPKGRMAMLTSPLIISQVKVNLTSQFGLERFQVSLRQKYSSTNGPSDNFMWTDKNNITYGLNSDLKWTPNEPNDWPTTGENQEEDCADITGDTAGISDSQCTDPAYSRRALCEYREPSMVFIPYFVGQSVSSSSTAIISGQTDIKVIQSEHCAILCHVFEVCEAFVFKKTQLTCTLLFRVDLTATEKIALDEATIYGY
uniref:C-type lectin domain-containing protein n=1 Tax=Plectus sambesii TaxID=2011161 RepID=A0A914WJJ5_9BILA